MKKRFWISGLLLLAFGQQICRAGTLQQVVIVTRHGVRSPTWTPDRLNQYSAAPWPDFGVPPGNLTPHGRALMKILGDFYRELYVSSGLLGKPACGDVKGAYFWADTDQRTIESARALAEGLLPGCKVEVHSKDPGANDPLFDPIEAGLAKPDPNLSLAAIEGRIGPNLTAVIDAHRAEFQILQRVLIGEGKASKSIFSEPTALKAEKNRVVMTGPLPVASTFTQNLLLEYANGMSGQQLGWGRLSLADLQHVLELHTAYAELMRRTPYLARVRGSNLLSHVTRTISQATTGKPVKGSLGSPHVRLVVISGHDTNLSNLSGMLGVSWALPSYQPDDAPPGGALIFSLWKSSQGGYSVRLQFVAQTLEQMHYGTVLTSQNPPMIANLFVPGCSRAEPGYPCSWSAFRQVIQKAVMPEFVDLEH